MQARIAVLPGDGIGEEVMVEALRVLDKVAQKFGHHFEYLQGLVGGAAFDRYGSHFPKETEELCGGSDAILFGSVGGPLPESHLPKWQNCEANSILALRKTFQFNANFRPVRVYPELKELSPLRGDIIGTGLDLLFVRELLGDVYFGEHASFTLEGKRCARDVAEYSEPQIASVAHTAFQAARRRRRNLTSVDKANVLDTSKLWRQIVREVSREYPDVELRDMLVDNCAMQIISHPSQFDVILSPNLFGDILSDAAAVLPGSLGLLPSASLNAEGFGLYEPSGGSAPDIAGKGIANPIAQILSAALMLRFSFSLEHEASAVERAVSETLCKGARTKDLARGSEKVLSTSEMGSKIVSCL